MAGPWEDYQSPAAPSVKERGAEASVEASEASAARTRGLTPSEIRKAEIDAQKSALDLEEAEAKKRERLSKEKAQSEGAAGAAKEMARVIAAAAAAKRLSQTGLFATGFGSQTARRISDATPAGTVAGLIDTVAANTAFQALTDMRKESPTGGALGNITEKELDLLKSTISNLDPSKSDADFQRSMDVVIDRYLDVYKKLGGDPALIEEQYRMRAGEPLPSGLIPSIKRVETAKPGAPEQAAPASTTELRTGGGDRYVTEESKRIAARLQEAFDAGASKDELDALSVELTGAPLPQDQLNAAVEFRDKGGKGARMVPGESERPLSQQLIGAAADSPVGAYAIGAGSALTGGLMDEAIGALQGPEAEERARFAREYSQSEYPLASALGEVGGGMLASIPAVRGARMLLPGISATRAAIAGEAALGGVTGFGEAKEGNRLEGAAAGLALGGAGGALPGAVARIAKPRTPEAVAALREAGVRDMSIGQVLGAPELEAGVAGVMPGGGDIALRAQRKAFDEFQDAYVNDALKNIGVELPKGLKPTRRMRKAQEAFDAAYDAARSNMVVKPDADMWRDLMDFNTRLNSDEFSEQAATRLKKLLQDQIQRRIQGPISGDEYKSLSSLLGKRRATFAKRQDQEMADGVAELQRIVDSAARRHSPPEAVALMDSADKGYAILTRAEEAARNLGNAPGEFTPQQALGASRKGDVTARNRAFVRGDARGQKLAEAGIEALGKAPPGEVSRMERGLGFTGSVLGSPVTLPINVAMGVANAPGVRQVLNTAIAGRRPAAVEGLADLVRDRPEYLAALGGGTALQGTRDRPEDLEELRRRYGLGDMSMLAWSPEDGY